MITILHITDLHIPDTNESAYDIDVHQNLLNTIQAMNDEAYDMVLVTGDIAYKQANFRSYEYVKQAFQTFYKPLYVLAGNHDTTEMLAQFFPNSFPNKQTNYRIPNPEITLLCMDSSASVITDSQAEWLQAELSQSKQVVLFVHHPILPTPVTYMESKYSLRRRESVLQVLEQHPYPIHIFCGHFHTDDVVTHKHITQYITPSILYQVNKQSTTFDIGSKAYGYRKICIDSQHVVTEVVWL